MLCNWKVPAAAILGVLAGIIAASGNPWPVQVTATTGSDDHNAVAQPNGKGTPKAGSKGTKPEEVKTYKKNFNGVIGRTFDQSKQSWPAPVMAKPGSPNVMFIVLDDVGFGQLGCFGGLSQTPNIDKLAKKGLRYNNFHTTALCSPTRACMLTGRNHHSCGLGVIAELSTGFPGYNGQIPFENGFLTEILTQFGYATFGLGKWHLTPDEEMNMGATKARWPLGRGFERFYGFLGGDSHQYYPDLVFDNHPVNPPKTPKQGYHFTTDITDKAVEFIQDLRAVTPDKPFFMYYCPGAMHAPHHVHQKWIDKHKGKFDMGWDKARELILDNQIKMGVVPRGTKLPPRNKEVAAWDSLGDKEKKLYSYMMEVYAGMLEHTDHEIGRLLDHLEEIGQFDNTLFVLISDNGASAEGGEHGLLNEGSFFNNQPEDVDYLWENKSKLGTPQSYNHYPFGWTMAGNTPFKKWKRELHLGGIRDPLIICWPKKIKAKGDIRHQFVHAIDIMPMVLDVLGIEPPDQIKGVPQNPIHGASFAHTFDDPKAPAKRKTQYFEMFGYRALYHDGWWAVSPLLPFGTPIDEKLLANLQWELYKVDEDFSQSNDLAAKYPDKVKEMDQHWWTEAGKYNVLPLDGRSTSRMITPRPQLTGPRTSYVYYQNSAPVKTSVAAPTLNRSYKITAHVVIPEEGGEGVLLAHGGLFGGWSFYLKEGKPRFTYNWQGREYYDVAAPEKLPPGKVTLGYQFEKKNKGKFGAGGIGKLFVNGKQVAEKEIPKTNPIGYWPHNEGLTCGYDNLTPAGQYETPFHCTAIITKVIVDAGP